MKNQFHPKYQHKDFWISALKFFVDFLGLPGSFLGFQQPSLLMILLTKSPGSPKSFQEAPRKLQKFQGRNPEIISLVFCKKLIFHKYIIKLTDLYLASKNKGLAPWDWIPQRLLWITTISYPSGRNYYFFILYSFYKSSPVHLVQAKFGLDFVTVNFFKNAK